MLRRILNCILGHEGKIDGLGGGMMPLAKYDIPMRVCLEDRDLAMFIP